MRRVITLTTDFGLSDTFVGVMKGIILSLVPEVTLVDLSHGIPPQDIVSAALALESAIDFFPRSTIHVAVVDPGVGTERAAVAVSTEQSILIGPDNGIFTLALNRAPMRHAVRLTNPAYFRHPVSNTFHGRDIFASVAGHLAAGIPLRSLGEPIDELVELALPVPKLIDGGIELTIIAIDRFGNLITNLKFEDIEDHMLSAVEIGSVRIEWVSRTYGDVEVGAPVAYFGSGGRLELAVREGNAASTWGIGRGGKVTLLLSNKG